MKPYRRAHITKDDEWYVISFLVYRGVEDSEHISQLHVKDFKDALLIANMLAEFVYGAP